MSKGKFEPGKRVLLLRDSLNPEPRVDHLVGTDQILGQQFKPFSNARGGTAWDIVGARSTQGHLVCWQEKFMILLDPDETPEQSSEAMRNLYSLPQKVTA